MVLCCFGPQLSPRGGDGGGGRGSAPQRSMKVSWGGDNGPKVDLPSDRMAAGLMSAAKNGANAVMQQLLSKPATPQDWAKGTVGPHLRTRAVALARAVDALLNPLLDVVDRTVGKPQDPDDDGRTYSWQDVEVVHIKDLLTEAGSELYTTKTLGRWSGAVKALDALLERLHAVWGLAAGQPDVVPQSVFLCQSVNRLLGMLTVVYSRNVTLESASSVERRALQWRELCEATGLREKYLAPTLNPSSKALMVYAKASTGGEKKLDVRVSRHDALWDSYQHVEQRGLLSSAAEPVCYKFFPQFVSDSGLVEHGEGHGPRKEFFTLVAAAACGQPVAASDAAPAAAAAAASTSQPQPPPRRHKPLFTFNRSAGAYWPNAALVDTASLRALYTHFGWLLGQALCNRATLGVPLPDLLFQSLLEGDAFQPTMEALRRFDPEMARAIQNTETLPEKEFRAMLELEGSDPALSRAEYASQAVREALRDNVAWQMAALRRGLTLSLDLALLKEWHVSASDLNRMVFGAGGAGADFKVRDVFRVVLDEELSTTSKPLAEGLWKVVDAWPLEMRKKFVLFVTGSDRLPLPGTELLRVELPFVAVNRADHEHHLRMLPQAHTCENVLELPNYWESLASGRRLGVDDISASVRKELERELLGVLRDRLELAVSNCNSYGLDETAGDARPGPSYVAREPARDALASTSGGYGSGGAGLRHSLPMDTSPVQLPRSHRGAGGSVFDLSSSPVAKLSFGGSKKNKIHPLPPELSASAAGDFGRPARLSNSSVATSRAHSRSNSNVPQITDLDTDGPFRLAPLRDGPLSLSRRGSSRLRLEDMDSTWNDAAHQRTQEEQDMDDLISSVDTGSGSPLRLPGQSSRMLPSSSRLTNQAARNRPGGPPSLDDMIAELSLD